MQCPWKSESSSPTVCLGVLRAFSLSLSVKRTGRWTPAGIRVDGSWATLSGSSLYSGNIPLGGGTELAGRGPSGKRRPPSLDQAHSKWKSHGASEKGDLPDSAAGAGVLSLDLTCVSPCSTWWRHRAAVILSHPEKHGYRATK